MNSMPTREALLQAMAEASARAQPQVLGPVFIR